MRLLRDVLQEKGKIERNTTAHKEYIESLYEKQVYDLKEAQRLETEDFLLEVPFDPDNLQNEEFDIEEKCRVFQQSTESLQHFTPTELADNIIRLLKTSPKETLGDDLLSLLGYEAIDFVSDIVSNHQKYIECYQKGKALKTKIIDTGDNKRGTAKRKKAISLSAVPSQAYDYPFVYSTEARREYVDAKTSLPTGTIHENFIKYEQFTIPHEACQMTEKARNIKLIEPTEPFISMAFKDYKTLNKMQSACYPVAYGTGENMLVCAPTGAGKTDVAMLAVLKCLKDHLVSDSKIDLNLFKIVYISPMKALATEIVSKFSSRLKDYGITVRECTGDTQLSKSQMDTSQMIVATPEKWDVLTRKAQGDVDFVALVKLLIIDEVHLLHDDRGPVLETIVARTLRQVEMSQSMIRIVGLSATLPNYIDVAFFLRVNPWKGMFYFDASFRPVPLTQSFIGIKGRNPSQTRIENDNICYERMKESLLQGNQVMIFVHSRNETHKTARNMIKFLLEDDLDISKMVNRDLMWEKANRSLMRSRNNEIRELFSKGFGVHHAGLIKSDRLLMEKMFRQGHIMVLVCTSTLAWGVNLPAHSVIIKGTLVYNAEKGDFCNLGILDVMQIFGRAGRPQYESFGEGTLITSHDQLYHYLRAITASAPIESRFLKHLPDNLNAEIVLGTVSSLDEACSWLGYTYFYIRLYRNPLAYGISGEESLKPEFDTKFIEKSIKFALF